MPRLSTRTKTGHGQMLSAAREQLGLKQVDVATRLGISETYVSQLEHRQVLPNTQAAHGYAAMVGYELVWSVSLNPINDST
jgi:ribosome-binding protein aMBF1 (putative translation factor)